MKIKRTKQPETRMSNKTIVVIKIVCSGILFFACCLFFFGNAGMFWESLISFNPFPVIFIAGTLYISFHIANLVGHYDDGKLYLADRHDWIFKVVFVITIVSMLIQCFLFSTPLSVPIIITVLCIVSGIMVLFTPKIVDNNNDEF